MLNLFVVKFKNVKALIELISLLAISEDIRESLVRWAQKNIKTPSDNVLLVDQTTRELKILTKKWYKTYYGHNRKKIRVYDARVNFTDICHECGIFFKEYTRIKGSENVTNLLGLTKDVRVNYVNKYPIARTNFYNIGLQSTDEEAYNVIVSSHLLKYFKAKTKEVYENN